MSFGADPRRWALFAVWDSEAALLAFVGGSAAGRLFGRGAVERWDGRLQLAGARGSWDGVRLVGSPSAPTAGPAGAPLAVLTRATIRAVRLPAFYAAVGATDAALRRAPGRLRSVGAGEWPLKRQATFSLWRDPAAARGFAYAGAEHVEVIRRVRAQGWYSEELFARFAVETVTGTWDGADPLAI